MCKEIKPEEVKNLNIEDGTELEMPEITFNMIVFAVSHCKYKNDMAKKNKEPEPFPGIDEAYELLTEIQRRR